MDFYEVYIMEILRDTIRKIMEEAMAEENDYEDSEEATFPKSIYEQMSDEELVCLYESMTYDKLDDFIRNESLPFNICQFPKKNRYTLFNNRNLKKASILKDSLSLKCWLCFLL